MDTDSAPPPIMPPPAGVHVPPDAETQHYRYVDALRGLAVLMVVFIHSSLTVQETITKDYPGVIIGAFAARAPQLFYMVSGMMLFLSLAVRSRSELRPDVNFFIRRFFRIAPLFYLAMAMKRLLPPALAVNIGLPTNALDTLLGVVFLNAWKPSAINAAVYGGWSVAIEMNFYLLLPYLYSRIRTTSQALAFLAGSYLVGRVVSELAYQYFAAGQEPYYQMLLNVYFHVWWLPVELHVFAAGIFLYFVVQEMRKSKVLYGPQRRTIASALLIASLLVLFSSSSDVTVAVLAFGLMIPSLHLYENPILVNRVTCFYGRISYGLYVSHFFLLQPVGRFMAHLGLTQLGPDDLLNRVKIALFTLLMLLISTPLAYVLTLTVEKWGIEWGRSLIRLLEGRPRPAALPARARA